jgi:type IV secretion system protein VirB2
MAEAFLQLPTSDQRDALEFASGVSGRPIHLLQKDVWVVWALETLYASAVGLAMNAVSRVTSHIQSQTVIFQRGVLAFALVAMPAMAFAQTVSGGASPATMLNNVCTFILGPFGETIAVLGIIGIGFLFMFGRASLGVIAGVVGGIVIMFGASYLGQTLTGG